MKERYSTPEVAEILGVHATTVFRWVKAGKLEGYHSGKRTEFKIPYEAVVDLCKKRGFPPKRMEIIETRRILVIKDDENAPDITESIIKKLPEFEVKSVEDIFRAGYLLKAFKPHLILVDNVMFDNMNGKDFLDLVRNDPELKRTRIAKYTGTDMTVEQAQEQGFDGLVLKSTDFKVMVETIRRLVLERNDKNSNNLN